MAGPHEVQKSIGAARGKHPDRRPVVVGVCGGGGTACGGASANIKPHEEGAPGSLSALPLAIPKKFRYCDVGSSVLFLQTHGHLSKLFAQPVFGSNRGEKSCTETQGHGSRNTNLFHNVVFECITLFSLAKAFGCDCKIEWNKREWPLPEAVVGPQD